MGKNISQSLLIGLKWKLWTCSETDFQQVFAIQLFSMCMYFKNMGKRPAHTHIVGPTSI